MPNTVGFFCMNTKLKYFHAVVELVMLPACVDYLVPKKGEVRLVPRGGVFTDLLVSLDSCFRETVRKVASLRVLNCPNLTRNLKLTVEEGEWMQAQMDSMTSCAHVLQRVGRRHPISWERALACEAAGPSLPLRDPAELFVGSVRDHAEAFSLPLKAHQPGYVTWWDGSFVERGQEYPKSDF